MGLLDTIRDHWLSRPAVRQRIGTLPVGRAISRFHARRLFGQVSGFAQSQMLAAAVDLGVFEALTGGPLSNQSLKERLPIAPDGFAALLQALRAMGMVQMRRSGAVALTTDGWVVATDAGLRAMIAHNRLVYRDLVDPVALLKAPGSGELGRFWPYHGSSGNAADYSRLMAVSLDMVVADLLRAVRFSRFEGVMDVGGGEGRFLTMLARSGYRGTLTLVDLPAVVARARAILDQQGLAGRIDLVPGDAATAWPSHAEAITMIRLLHDLNDDEAVALAARAAAALPRSGCLIVAEPLARSGRDAQTTYFAAYFAAMGSGRLRTLAEMRALLARAGLRIERVRSGVLATAIVARPC